MSLLFEQAVARGKARWADRYVEPITTRLQREWFDRGRVEITTTYTSGEQAIRRGRIGITTGWQPALILVHRSNDSGSWDALDVNDVVTAWIDKHGRRHPIH